MNPENVVFDRYELHEQLGAGGTSVVWRATDQLLHQTVALKRVSFAALGGEQAQLTRDRALREARLAAQLRSHPNVVAVYDVLVDQGDIWLVMEYQPRVGRVLAGRHPLRRRRRPAARPHQRNPGRQADTPQAATLVVTSPTMTPPRNSCPMSSPACEAESVRTASPTNAL